jgi:hypothetical protein
VSVSSPFMRIGAESALLAPSTIAIGKSIFSWWL